MADVLIDYEKIVGRSEKAILFKINDHKTIWLAKSQIHVDEADKDIVMSAWLADEKQLKPNN